VPFIRNLRQLQDIVFTVLGTVKYI